MLLACRKWSLLLTNIARPIVVTIRRRHSLWWLVVVRRRHLLLLLPVNRLCLLRICLLLSMSIRRLLPACAVRPLLLWLAVRSLGIRLLLRRVEWLSFAFAVVEDQVDCVDGAGDVAAEGQEDVDNEIDAASAFDDYCDGWEEDGEDNDADV